MNNSIGFFSCLNGTNGEITFRQVNEMYILYWKHQPYLSGKATEKNKIKMLDRLKNSLNILEEIKK